MKFKRSKSITITLLVLIFTGSLLELVPKKKSHSSKVLSQMSHDELHCLGSFLRVLLFSDDFSYLLFGSKPVAATGFEKSPPFRFSRSYLSRSDFEINKGLELFKKNQDFFSSKEIFVRISEDEEDHFVLMINKENLLRTLREHIKDFQQVLGPETTVERLFNQIIENEHLADVIKQHHALLGILLGYGRENAWLFHEKHAITLKMREFEPPLKKDDDALRKLFDEIDQMTTFFSEESHEWKYVLTSPRIHLPHFMADPTGPDTKKLKEQYGKERAAMRKRFSEQGHIEATFQKLMDD